MTATAADVRRFNGLRAERVHLEAQVERNVDAQHATAAEARRALGVVDAELRDLEPLIRATPGTEYLFAKRRRRAGANVQPSPQSSKEASQSDTPTKEADVARKSKAVVLEETLVALRRAEKSAGTTKWALSGAGAKKNPPSPERKKALEEKLAGEQARIAELRAKRDELRG